MRVLVACEYSGVVRDAFAMLGHEAYSCDILPTESPGQHIQGDVLEILSDGWDLMVAHPPCQYLTYAGLRHWHQQGRAAKRDQAMRFFMALYDAPIPMVAIENPLGHPNSVFRKADQTIHPYMFGDPHVKRTCLWLRGLPRLEYDKSLPKPSPLSVHRRRSTKNFRGGELKNNYFAHVVHGSHKRSKFWPGIAKAMAEQWGGVQVSEQPARVEAVVV